MEKKQLILIGLAIVAGIAATVMTSMYVTSTIEKQAQAMKEEFDAKQKQMVALMEQQNDQKLAALAQEMKNISDAQAQELKKELAAVQTKVQAAKVAVKRVKPSLAVKTPPGKRAITIMVNSLAAVGGLLNPGDTVDVIGNLNVPSGLGVVKPEDKTSVTAMIFQGLLVLAVNTNLDEPGAFYDEQQSAAAVKVTVAVDPEEAGLLSFADKNGKLELALRSPQETERKMVKTSTWKTLADYVLQNQGADFNLSDDLRGVVHKEEDSVTPENIQIFRGGKEL